MFTRLVAAAYLAAGTLAACHAQDLSFITANASLPKVMYV